MGARSIVFLSVLAIGGCRTDKETSDPGSSQDNLLGLGVHPGESAGNEGNSDPGVDVPVKCLTDPGDPDCDEVLGTTRTDGGGMEFGDACRTNVCRGRGDCTLDPEGSVTCECDDEGLGPNCEKQN